MFAHKQEIWRNIDEKGIFNVLVCQVFVLELKGSRGEPNGEVTRSRWSFEVQNLVHFIFVFTYLLYLLFNLSILTIFPACLNGHYACAGIFLWLNIYGSLSSGCKMLNTVVAVNIYDRWWLVAFFKYKIYFCLTPNHSCVSLDKCVYAGVLKDL